MADMTINEMDSFDFSAPFHEIIIYDDSEDDVKNTATIHDQAYSGDDNFDIIIKNGCAQSNNENSEFAQEPITEHARKKRELSEIENKIDPIDKKKKTANEFISNEKENDVQAQFFANTIAQSTSEHSSVLEIEKNTTLQNNENITGRTNSQSGTELNGKEKSMAADIPLQKGASEKLSDYFNDMCDTLSQNLILTVQAYREHLENIVESETMQLSPNYKYSKNLYWSLKCQYYQLSYCAVVNIVLQQEIKNIPKFTEDFLNNTVKYAKEKLNLVYSKQDIMPFFYELIDWAKQKKRFLDDRCNFSAAHEKEKQNKKQSRVNDTPLLSKQLAQPPEFPPHQNSNGLINKQTYNPPPNRDIEPYNESSISVDARRSRPTVLSQHSSSAQPPILSQYSNSTKPPILPQYQNPQTSQPQSYLPKYPNRAQPTVPPYPSFGQPSALPSYQSLAQSPALQPYSHRIQPAVLPQYPNWACPQNTPQYRPRALKTQKFPEYSDSVKRPVLPPYPNTQNMNHQMQKVPIFTGGAPDREVVISVDTTILSKCSLINSIQRSLETPPPPTKDSSENRFHAPYQDTLSSCLNTRDLNYQKENTQLYDHSVPAQANSTTNNYNSYQMNYHDNSKRQQMDTYYYPRSSTKQPMQPHCASYNPYIQQHQYSSDYDKNPSQAALLKDNQRQNEQLNQSIESSRSSVSTDSGFASPLQFHMDGMISSPEGQLTPLITHVTSLNPNATQIVEGLCYVCHARTNKKCRVCYQYYYCSTGCQTLDWRRHKNFCKTAHDTRLVKTV